MKLPASSLHFKLNLPGNALGKVYCASINIDEKRTGGAKFRQLGWYQLVLVLKGEGFYRDAHESELRLRRGALVIIPPDTPHQCEPDTGSAWSRIVILFNGALFDLLREDGWLSFQKKPVILAPLAKWYKKIYALLLLQNEERTQPIRYLNRFLAVLNAIPTEKQETADDGKPAWLATAISMIEAADQTRALDVPQIARKCKLGYSSFRQQFSRHIGFGPSEYHKSLRIKIASEMIAYGSASFKQIALQLGYCDVFHFIKHFKAKTGFSPGQFKAELISRNIKVIDSERVQKIAFQEWLKSEGEKRLLEEKIAAERRRNWRLVFQEDFSSKKNLERWTIQGSWLCTNGELCVRGKEGLVVTLNSPIPGDVRLVFDCHLESDFLSDVACFLSALKSSDETLAYTTGYFFQYGAFQNRRIMLAGNDRVLWNQSASPLVRGQRYHVDAQKIGNRLILNVDSKTIFDVRDHYAALGAEHAFLGLHSWGTEACFSNVQVYTRDSAVQADLLETAEDFLARGDYPTARGLFQEVLHSSQNVPRSEQAKDGLAKTLNRIGLTAEFPTIQKRLMHTWPKAIIKLDSRGIIVNIRASGIDDLSPLQGLPVSELYCDNNRITSLQPLKGMKELKKLSCYKNQIESLEPLQGMNLESLECSDNQISRLDPLRGMELRYLACLHNQISNIEPLNGIKLDHLACGFNEIEKLDPLRGMGLLRLSCPNNRIKSLEPLQGMSLDFINCSHNQIHDLEPLRGTGLPQIRCNGNQITSLAPLQGLPLNSLSCAWNRIDSLDPLEGLSLSILSCHDNPIKSIKPLLQHLPGGLYVSIDNLDPTELQFIQARVKTPGFAELLRNAEILLHLKQKNYNQIRSLAQPFGKHRYLIIPLESTWLEAKQICEELGGQLATIRNRKENDFLRSIVIEGSYNWIGLYSEPEKMAWVTGEPCCFQNIDSRTFIPGQSCILTSSGVWSGNYPELETDYFCVEWDA